MAKKKGESTQHHFVKVDLKFPRLLKQIKDLSLEDLEALFGSVNLIQQMTWDDVYKTSTKGTGKRGINYEPLGQATDEGKQIASIRISRSFRARVCRDGQWMRFISLHPDHDSAYRKR